MSKQPAPAGLRIREVKELSPPSHLSRAVPLGTPSAQTVHDARQAINRILSGIDVRMLVVVGPCSIHDPLAALEYARRLVEQRERFSDRLEIVMRVYFEKPRTTVGWKGLINDPDLDGQFNINKGLHIAREMLLQINALGLPASTGYLDMIPPQYIADLIPWGAHVARPTEQPVPRYMASGPSLRGGLSIATTGQ